MLAIKDDEEASSVSGNFQRADGWCKSAVRLRRTYTLELTRHAGIAYISCPEASVSANEAEKRVVLFRWEWMNRQVSSIHSKQGGTAG